MSKSPEVKETASQRALADVGRQQMADFKARWLPVQQRLAQGIVAAGADDSFQRRRAATMAGVDTSARFAQAGDKLDAQAAASGSLGSSAHKLGITGMAEDQATSQGMNQVAADQGVTDQYIAGLGAVTALGRGEKATAINGMTAQAAMSGRQAEADAQRSMDARVGNMRLVGTLGGMGAMQYLQQRPGLATPSSPYVATSSDRQGLYGNVGYGARDPLDPTQVFSNPSGFTNTPTYPSGIGGP